MRESFPNAEVCLDLESSPRNDSKPKEPAGRRRYETVAVSLVSYEGGAT
jgi:hypothetical protein